MCKGGKGISADIYAQGKRGRTHSPPLRGEEGEHALFHDEHCRPPLGRKSQHIIGAIVTSPTASPLSFVVTKSLSPQQCPMGIAMPSSSSTVELTEEAVFLFNFFPQESFHGEKLSAWKP